MARIEYFESVRHLMIQMKKEGNYSQDKVNEEVECILQEKFTELEMTNDYPNAKKAVLVAVEGESDVKFISDKLSDNVILLSPSTEMGTGKDWVKKVVLHPNVIGKSYYENVIGICDRDYDTIERHDRIFHYDGCCLEMMLIASEHAMGKITTEFYCGKQNFTELRLNILRALKWVSIFRKINSEKKWGVNFGNKSHFPVSDVIDEQLNFQLEKAKDTIERRNSNNKNSFQTWFVMVSEEYDKNSGNLESLLEITQGHDFISCFKKCCDSVFLKNDISRDAVEHSLRCAYRMSDFQQTALYSELKAYEQKTSLPILSA